MRTALTLVTASLLAAPLAACAHGGASAADSRARLQQLAGGALPASALDASIRRCATNLEDARSVASGDLLLPTRLAHAEGENVLTLVQRHRARWLFTRSAGSDREPTVYLDGQRLGDVAQMRVITAGSVHLARRISAPQAQLKYGMNHPEGAIELYTRCTDE